MDNWNGLDFFIFLIFAVNTILGMARGAAKEIISTMCLCVALVCTIKFTIPLSVFFNKSPLMNDVVTSRFVQNFIASLELNPLSISTLKEIFYSISLLICFVGTFSVCEGALSMSGLLEVYSFPYAWLNRKLGAVLGGIRGYVITLILISITTLHLFKESDDSIFKSSYFVRLFASSAATFDGIVSKQKPEQYQKIFKDKNLYNPLKTLQDLSKPALEGVAPADLSSAPPTAATPAAQQPNTSSTDFQEQLRFNK